MSLEFTRPLVSLVIPAFNEGDRLPATLTATLEYLSYQPYASELIIVDDGCTDSTPGVIARFAELDLRVRTVTLPSNRGKGAAVRSGMRMANGDLLLYMDADLSYPLHHIEDILSGFDKGYDVVVGSRSHPVAKTKVAAALSRRVASKVLSICVGLLGVTDHDDTQCGLKGFTRDAAEQLFSRQRISGFAFDLELLYIARRLNLAVLEVPVALSAADGSRIRLLRDGVAFMSDLWSMLWRGARGVYDVPGRRGTDFGEPGPKGSASDTDILDKGAPRN